MDNHNQPTRRQFFETIGTALIGGGIATNLVILGNKAHVSPMTQICGDDPLNFESRVRIPIMYGLVTTALIDVCLHIQRRYFNLLGIKECPVDRAKRGTLTTILLGGLSAYCFLSIKVPESAKDSKTIFCDIPLETLRHQLAYLKSLDASQLSQSSQEILRQTIHNLEAEIARLENEGRSR
jgi:hypothetical protein